MSDIKEIQFNQIFPTNLKLNDPLYHLTFGYNTTGKDSDVVFYMTPSRKMLQVSTISQLKRLFINLATTKSSVMEVIVITGVRGKYEATVSDSYMEIRRTLRPDRSQGEALWTHCKKSGDPILDTELIKLLIKIYKSECPYTGALGIQSKMFIRFSNNALDLITG